MQYGNRISRPNITRASVEAALSLLTYTTNRDTSDAVTLKTLVLVDDFLDSPHRPAASDMRRYALSMILTDIITGQLTQVRRLFDLPAPGVDASLSEVQANILEDSQQSSADLSGWSFLYYHYVRSELGISQEKYAKISHVARRTVRRYSSHILDVLVDVIIQREWAARQKRHHQNLKAVLPLPKNQMFVGRDAEMTTFKTWLTDDEPRCILIAGSVDCGKTTFVNQCLHELIDDSAPDYLFWFDGLSASLESIQQSLLDATHSTSHQQLTRLLAKRQTVVVLDNVHYLDKQTLQQAVEMLQHTTCVLVTHQPPVLTSIMHRIDLEPLGLESLLSIARQIRPFMPDEELYRQVQSVWQQSGAQLTMLKTVLMRPESSDDSVLKSANYADMFDYLSSTACHVWWLLASRQITTARYLLPELRTMFSSAIQELRYHAVLTPRRDVSFIADDAAAFIREQYQADDELLEQALNLFQSVRSPVFLAGLLLRAPAYLPAETVREIMVYCWQQYSARGNAALWHRVFRLYQNQVADDPLLMLFYGKFLSYQHDLDAAYQTLDKAISLAGLRGDFQLQLQARLALVAFFREISRYTIAWGELNQIEDALSRYNNTDLQHRFILEKTQLMFETSFHLTDDHILPELLQQSQAAGNQMVQQVFQAEYQLSTDELEQCRHLADRVLQAQDLLPAGTMAVFTILGRSYIAEGQVKRGIDWLNAALSLLEQQNNTLVAARAQANLGGALLLMETPEAYQEAEMLLKRAEAHQQIIEDTVGLNVTYRNLNILSRVRT